MWELAIVAGVAVLGSGGAAWQGVRVGLNGMRERQTRMETRLDRVDRVLDGVNARTARIEGRIAEQDHREAVRRA